MTARLIPQSVEDAMVRDGMPPLRLSGGEPVVYHDPDEPMPEHLFSREADQP